MRPHTALPALFALSLGALAPALVAAPAAAQDARACSNEVRRLSEGFPAATGRDPQAPVAIGERQPGTRAGASLSDEQQRQVSDVVQQARLAGEQGDGALCMQRLGEARAMLRQAGVGSPLPGGAGGAGQDIGADRSPNLQGTEAPPDQRGLSGTTPSAPGVTGGPLSGTGAPNAQGAETPASPPTAGQPRRNTRDSATNPGVTGGTGTTGGSTPRVSPGGGGSTGGSSGGGSSGGGSSGGGSSGGGGR